MEKDQKKAAAQSIHSCTDCGVKNCAMRNASYPEFCPTAALTEAEIEEVTNLYLHNRVNHKVAVAAAEVEGCFYGKYTRVEEIVEFAKKNRRQENWDCDLHRASGGIPHICQNPETERVRGLWDIL